MSPVACESLLMLASLLTVAAPLDQAKTLRASGLRIPPWVPFAVLTGLGIASLIFGLLNPLMIAVAFAQG
jgi:hypothetical protein